MNIFWGDLHNHCGITYGFGSLENALAAAREQLDFCAVIGHAMWPDMPEPETKELEFLVDFHLKGFSKLKQNWREVRETIAKANKPHEFVTFQGYEIHSSVYGDHHILSPADDLPLVQADSPAELVAKLAPKPVIAVPHHVGYTPGYRGTNWDAFSTVNSPIVEVFSKHGCSISDKSMYPYYHTMGPRDSRNTIYTGLRKGYRFGFVGSTDHHAGYPGSHGDGRLAVLAREKTREAIWEALLSRRTYAVTGDKIACQFRINGADMGSEIQDTDLRQITLDVKACDTIDKIIIYKNTRPWRVVNGEFLPMTETSRTYKVRVEMGWGKSTEGYDWLGSVVIRGGRLVSVETCFRGQSVLAPTPEMRENPDINKLNNKLIEKTADKAEWTCTTFKNPSTLHPATASIIFEIEGDHHSVLELYLNGKKAEVTIGELLLGSRSSHLQAHVSEAYLIHNAVPQSQYQFHGEWEDSEKETECDNYHVEVKQMNGQCAWISPIFVLS